MTLRLMDTRGVEKEFHDNHVGTYIWLPGSLKKMIGEVLGAPIYSVGRETYGPMDNRTYGDRVFVQTGERDGNYLLTFEVVEPELCARVVEILSTPPTKELRDESQRDYEQKCRELGI
jgi:hypothetical protein